MFSHPFLNIVMSENATGFFCCSWQVSMVENNFLLEFCLSQLFFLVLQRCTSENNNDIIGM